MALGVKSPACVLAALATGAVFKAVACYWVSKNEANSYERAGRVAELWVYPVKSCGGIQVEQAECTTLGLAYFSAGDRQWTVATADGVYLTQRQEPTMALISVQVIGDFLQLDAPDMESFVLPIDLPVTADRLSQVTVKTDTVTSLDCGDEAAAWLCRYLKRTGLRLHFSAPSLEKRQCCLNKKNWNHPAQPGDLTAFSDYSGYMILSTASLDALNERLSDPVPITNFRANIIVSDCSAFEEDSWISIRIGDAQLRALDACTRCVMVTIDQEMGSKDPQEEPLNTLKTFRQKEPYGIKPAFGVNFTLDNPGTIHVGDIIYAKKGQHEVSAKNV